ncbi:MAG: protein kinase, partial [Gammaproteobacteria bacterium]
ATLLDGSPLPTGMTFNPTTRTFSWTPNDASLIGPLDLKVTATDNGTPSLNVFDSFTLNITKSLFLSRVSPTFVYTEDHEQIISPIEITTPSPTVTAKVTLREHADGELLTETISGVTSRYDKNTGEWQAAGNTAAINALLSRLKFKPRNYFYGSVHLDAEITDSFNQSESGTITGTGIHENHPPIIIGSRKDQPECITANIGEEHNCTTIPGSVYDPDGDPVTTITTLKNGNALPPSLYYDPTTMAVLGRINNASYIGTWEFVFKAMDPYNSTTTDTYTVQSSQTLFAVGLNTPFTYTQDGTTRIPAFEVITPSNSIVACFNANDTKAGNILSKAMIVSSAQFFTGEGGSCFNDTVPHANTLLARLDYTPPTSYRDNFILSVKFTDEFGQTVIGNRTATGLSAEPKINATPYIIISTVVGSLVLAGAGALIIVWCRNKNKPRRKFLSEDILEGVRLNPIAFGKNIIIKPESIEKMKLLGKGGAGEVYLAKWNGSLVALKILTICSQANQENIQNSFETEAAVMINLRHENIIRFLGLCQNPPSLVMEYMQLGSLDKVLASDIPLTWALRLKIAYDIIKGLAYLHNLPNPIIHRDLKSPNILLSRNFRAVITDFGISTAQALIRATTYTNGGGGTMAWMAPEQINNPNPNIDTSSKKSDIYSFGMICWEIATRQLPGCTPFIIIQQATNGTRPKIPEGTPPKFSEIITRCWAQDPNARPEAQALVKEFEALVPEEPDINAIPQPLPLSEAQHSTLMPPPKKANGQHRPTPTQHELQTITHANPLLSRAPHSILMAPPKAAPALPKPNPKGISNLHTRPAPGPTPSASATPSFFSIPQSPLYTPSGPSNQPLPSAPKSSGFAAPSPMYVPSSSTPPAVRQAS